MRYFIEKDIESILDISFKTLQKLSGKTILITGAGGFLGRYMIESFKQLNLKIDKPAYIIALDNYITSSNTKPEKDLNIEWIYGDASIASQLPDKFDYIIHAAGIASPEHYRAKPIETIDIAVNVTKSLLDKAKLDNARMLFFSSSEIYGDPSSDNIPTKESYRGNVSCRGPRSCYDESKRLGETICWIYEKYYGVHVSVVRPFNIYGPGMMPKDYRVLPNFAKSIYKKERLKVYGSGDQTRTFCYVSDAIIAFFKILIESECPEVFNVGNPDEEISMRSLAEKVLTITNSSVDIEIVDYPNTYPDDEPNRRCPDISKLFETFNYKPTTTLNDGLFKFFKWTEENYKYADL